MRKSEIRRYLHFYSKIKDELNENADKVTIIQNRRKKNIKISSWVLKLKDIISIIVDNEANPIIAEIINCNIVKGQSDKTLLCRLPISESTYYRWKSRIIDKIYDLLIVNGEISADEILSDSIALY